MLLAVREAKAAIDRNPEFDIKSIDDALMTGEQAIDNGHWDDACEWFAKALALAASVPNVKADLGNLIPRF